MFVPAKRSFTLIEVVVALAILSLSIVGLLQLLSVSQKNVAKAQEQWRQMHILSQAIEYYLLQGESASAPDVEFFPYEDYRVDVSYDDAEGIPDEFNNIEGQLPLRHCKFELIRLRDRQVVETIIIDRVDYDSAEVTESLQ